MYSIGLAISDEISGALDFSYFKSGLQFFLFDIVKLLNKTRYFFLFAFIDIIEK